MRAIRKLVLLFRQNSPILKNLQLWLDSSDIQTITKAYQNLAATGSGTSGTKIITASADQTSLIQPGEKLRIGGVDIYTVSSVATTTINTVEILTNDYITQVMALDRVSQWNDKSGNGHNATQGTALAQPVYTPAIQNGKAVLTFDGTANTLILPSGLYSIPAANNTMFVVSKQGTNNGDYGLIDFLNSFSGSFRYVLDGETTPGRMQFINGTNSTGTVLDNVIRTNANIFTAFRNATILSLSVNNGVPSTANTGNNSPGVAIANIGSYSGVSGFLLGSVAEILIYNRALSASEILQINLELKSKWGTA